ncbi:hypothetical protein [Nocardioides marmorisolisilvae]|uniref:Lipoprotein n=1 Tax=Nocardioides marmorisolisilvae TaxID=1542737 RepID=A0A3N0E004_9ACTN|nr:hypothetical protein [Nocardioides marmorisolisilvae]RNL81096.1 hypothetical protein EFL95_01580 [Nocardioides marmorisolisilvae]
MRRVLLVALALSATGLVGACGKSEPPAPLHVTWRESEGHPACVYDAQRRAVTAKLVITGDAGTRKRVAVTVTAYADENTSVPVGSTGGSVPVHGTMHLPVDFTIATTDPPHVDEDGVAACRLSVRY